MRPFDGHAGLRGQHPDTAGMVDMAMRDQYLGQRQPFLLEKSENALNVATGVDDRGLAGFLAPKNGAILLKWSNRDDGVAHGGSELTEWRHYRTPPWRRAFSSLA
jgi:hypothetical protein